MPVRELFLKIIISKLSAFVLSKKEIEILKMINTHFQLMDNGSRYIHTHYAIAFIVNSIQVFSHYRLKSVIK